MQLRQRLDDQIRVSEIQLRSDMIGDSHDKDASAICRQYTIRRIFKDHRFIFLDL